MLAGFRASAFTVWPSARTSRKVAGKSLSQKVVVARAATASSTGARQGGVTGGGMYFALNARLPKPAPRARQFHPKSGAVGTPVRIWGSDLLSAGRIQWNYRGGGLQQRAQLRLGHGSLGSHHRTDHDHDAGRDLHDARQLCGGVAASPTACQR